MASLDHIVIGAATLGEGADFVEALLGLRPGPGGAHEGAGTHNLLLGLGEGAYLEVIAPDPGQPAPARPRLFGLDDAALLRRLAARPALIAWVARTEGLDALAARLGPGGLGPARPMSRGGLSWRFASPPTDADLGGLLPSTIEWVDPARPPSLPESGCRLLGLEGGHPEPKILAAALAQRGLSQAMRVGHAPVPRLAVTLTGPDGRPCSLAST
ncbi:VOC family protein [Roseomonas sp. KE2513]|uniref:VOC family protein n=1 Tax=Roseomonas sp. KE2513 TaxID=2479202 RepID=UPI0018DFD31B|nr:VOC family protein [Roseomonas sp. KE2513]MBI0535117.1 VOC family protein [Roseomonas sp. KE2513]